MGFDKTKVIYAAEKYLALGKIAQAIQEYCKIVEHEPHDFTALNTLGDLYARQNKAQEAIGCFLRVAEHYREQGFSLKAIAMYKKILRQSPGVPGVAHNLAALYEQQGLYVEAREQYLQIADAASRTGQAREMLEALRRIADFDPKNVDIRVRLAEGYAAEGMNREGADAYVEAGELLLVRGDAQGARDIYREAHELHPANHAVLQGLVAASTALGAAEEAAAVLERTVADWPDDTELRAMLARTYIDAEDATAAERATEALVAAEPSNFPLLFEVSRLYLRRSSVNEAVRVLVRAVEPALSGKQEAALLEILSEALASDPEHIEALKLLLRIYTWQRDDERMHSTLERLAEAAQKHKLVEEERRALEHLVRLVPFDQSYHERLEALGGATGAGYDDMLGSPQPDTTPAAPAVEVPTVEGVTAGGESPLYEFEPFALGGPAPQGASSPGAEFEWNTVAEIGESSQPAQQRAHADPRASFADLNEELADAPARASDTAGAFDVSFGQAAFEPSTFGQQGTQDTDALGGFDVAAAPEAGSPERSEAMLRQELESVDFYLEQGYADIARDTLDMLERQFGAAPEIAARRERLAGGAANAGSNGSGAKHAAAPSENTFSLDDLASFDLGPAPEPAAQAAEPAAAANASQPARRADDKAAKKSAKSAKSSKSARKGEESEPRGATIDPGLAAVFDEFREAVEDEQPVSNDEDFETHYNLGLAYKEMDLMDEAVEQFQRAIALSAPEDGTPHYLQCCNMLGHCFMQKRMPRPAALWFQKGLDIPDLSEDEYQALRYELALAYEEMGDIDRAIDAFSEVYGVDVSYRGVADKLRELQSLKTANSNS